MMPPNSGAVGEGLAHAFRCQSLSLSPPGRYLLQLSPAISRQAALNVRLSCSVPQKVAVPDSTPFQPSDRPRQTVCGRAVYHNQLQRSRHRKGKGGKGGSHLCPQSSPMPPQTQHQGSQPCDPFGAVSWNPEILPPPPAAKLSRFCPGANPAELKPARLD